MIAARIGQGRHSRVLRDETRPVLSQLDWSLGRNRLAFPGRVQTRLAPPLSVPQASPDVVTERIPQHEQELSESVSPNTADYGTGFGTLNDIATTDLETVPASQLAQAQQKLAERVAVAATRGILNARQPSIDLPIGGARPQIDTGIFDSSVRDQDPGEQPDEPVTANLRITTSSDVPAQLAEEEFQSTSLGVRCIDPSEVAVASWGTDIPPTEQIAEYRSRLFSEFDKLDTEIAVKLARLYLHYGFGAEAKQVLEIDPALARSERALVEIANIMEFGTAGDQSHLASFADCDSDSALWGILAQQVIDPSKPINADAALRAVNALSMHLRRFIAPKLSSRLLEYGDETRAETALRSVERTPEEPTARVKLARAELQMAKGETEAAQETLADIVSSNEQQSAEALIKFIDSHLDADTQIDQSVATLVEAYAIELRDDPLGPELKRAHVLALAKSEQFDAAFAELDRMRTRERGNTESELRTLLLDIVTRSAPDVIFLERAFEQTAGNSPLTDADTSVAMAERAQRLGFSRAASALLDEAVDLPSTSRVRLLRAEIALSLDQPAEALDQLFGIDGEEANRLRAQARQLQQEYADAQEMFKALGDQEESMRAALLAEDWESVSELEDSPLAPIAGLVETPMEASERVDGMLGRLSEAVSESRQAREMIETLLLGSSTDDTAAEP